MDWKGRSVVTQGEWLDVILTVNSAEEADDLVAATVRESPQTDPQVVRSNIGYLAGYLSETEAQKIFRLFKTEHPIFGRCFPTAREAFAKGVELAARHILSLGVPSMEVNNGGDSETPG